MRPMDADHDDIAALRSAWNRRRLVPRPRGEAARAVAQVSSTEAMIA